MVPRTWIIYTLHDPRAPLEVRYVGKTHQRPNSRLKNHLVYAKNGQDKTRCGNWKRVLLRADVRPVLMIVQTGFGNDWNEAEIRWIAYFKARGDRLTNHTDGGAGIIGMKHSKAAKEKIGEGQKKAWLNPTSRSQRCASIKRAHSDPEVKERHRAGAKRGQNTPEAKELQGAAQKASWVDPEIRSKRSAGIKKAAENPEVRAKLRAATKSTWADPEARAKRIAALKAGWARKRAKNETVQPSASSSSPCTSWSDPAWGPRA